MEYQVGAVSVKCRVRGQRVMLDRHLAELYGVTTSRLNEAVKRNIERFPDRFVFHLTNQEVEDWKFQIGISNSITKEECLRFQFGILDDSSGNQEFGNLMSQFATSSWGGRRKLPCVFTEQGVSMLSAVLKSPTAVKELHCDCGCFGVGSDRYLGYNFKFYFTKKFIFVIGGGNNSYLCDIMTRYEKPALTLEDQVALLKQRGLCIDDELRTIRHLSNISYHRLTAYMLPFQKIVDGKVTAHFKEGTTWDDIYDLYRFDRKFRLLVFDAIERIEVALRTQIVYQLSQEYGPHWQDNPELFKVVHYDKKKGKKEKKKKTGKKCTYSLYEELQKHISSLRNNTSYGDALKRYHQTYSEPKNPPSWVCMELMYFNELSKICKYLQVRQDVVKIARYFGVQSDKVFCSWLHSINYVRNLCAHHARLWNIRLSIQPEKFYYRETEERGRIWLSDEEVESVQSSKMYYLMCVILYLLETVNPNSKFRKHFFDLLAEYPKIDVGYMGFPENWREHALWKNKM